MVQAVLKEKIQVAETAVDEQVRVLQARFATEEEFSRSLQEEGMNPPSLREKIRRNLAIGKLVDQRVNASVTVSDAEIADYYEKNGEKLRRPEGVHALEIFIRLDPRSDAASKGQVRQALEAVLKEAREGKDFAALAKEFSQGHGASEGGDVGWLSRNGPRPLLAEAGLKLKPGEISDILETPSGLHILKILEKKPAEDVSLEEARGKIRTLLRQQKEESALREYVASLKSGARIEILTPTP